MRDLCHRSIFFNFSVHFFIFITANDADKKDTSDNKGIIETNVFRYSQGDGDRTNNNDKNANADNNDDKNDGCNDDNKARSMDDRIG